MSQDHRQTAKDHVDTLITRLRSEGDQAAVKSLIEECDALSRAITAFHMEGIRFRMFNVDRLLHQTTLPAELLALVAETRRELETAGFHTRSHQAPTT